MNFKEERTVCPGHGSDLDNGKCPDCEIENSDGPDFVLYCDSSISLITPITESAKTWIKENVSGEQSWLGSGLAVERRYISDLLGGIDYDGLTVEERHCEIENDDGEEWIRGPEPMLDRP